jgi:hypothetical protein
MKRPPPRILRGFASALTLASFLSLPGESLIADIHDGHGDGGTAVAGATSHPDAGDAGAPAGRPVHDAHVDHCSHGHGPGLPSRASLPLVPAEAAGASVEPEASAGSFAPLPPLRPPID